MPLSTFGIPLLTAIGDSVDEGGSIAITPVGNWKWKVDGFYARMPEALDTDGGAIWTTGKVGDIFEDQFFYIPQDFGWLGGQFKGAKSLISGIGLKITDIKGEKFSKDMKSVSFKSKRKRSEMHNTKLGSDVLIQRVNLERVVYYRPERSGETWEMEKGVCALAMNVKQRKVYLFFGFTEVETGGTQRGGIRWNFREGEFFKGSEDCKGLLQNKWKHLRLVPEQIGRSGDGFNGDKIIVLGAGHQSGEGIADFGKSGKPIIGVLMGVALNVAQPDKCWAWPDEVKGEQNEWNGEIKKWREIGGGDGEWRKLMDARGRCIKKEKDKLKGKFRRERWDEVETYFREENSSTKLEMSGGPAKLTFDWGKGVTIFSGNKFDCNRGRCKTWTEATELPYKYKK